MRSVASKHQRRFLLTLDGGEDIVAALLALAQREDVSSAWVRGVGALRSASLERGGVDEPCEIVSLSGNLDCTGDEPQAHLRAAVIRVSGDGGLTGGVVRAALAQDVRLLVECFDDAPVQVERVQRRLSSARSERPSSARSERPSSARSERPSSARSERPSSPRRDKPQSTPAPVSPQVARRGWVDDDDDDDVDATGDSAELPSAGTSGAVSWADVAAASIEVEPEPEPEPEPDVRPVSQGRARRPHREPHRPPPRPARTKQFASGPQKGDFIQHRQFGLCKIELSDGRGGITVKLSSGVRKKIRLDFMDVGRARVEKGRTVYPLRPKTR